MHTTVKVKTKVTGKRVARTITPRQLRKTPIRKRKGILARQFAKGAIVYSQNSELILPDIEDSSLG